MNRVDAEEQSVENPEYTARQRAMAKARAAHREALENRVHRLEEELEDAKSALQEWDCGGAERESE